jgi:hypothetical protein
MTTDHEIIPGITIVEVENMAGVCFYLRTDREELPSGDVGHPWDCAMDGMESLLLALVIAKPELLGTDELKEAVQTAADWISNEYGD